jgi:6-pyruvoyltetrahydropterin/6-carboxytetrahydropterin synthase
VPSIKVKHNVEMAHRLLLTPGKCEAIHGHSWWVDLQLFGTIDKNYILAGLNFTEVKKEFRNYLDSNFDHRLLLNHDDPWAQKIWLPDAVGEENLPGLQTSSGDPTTEWFAEHIGLWASNTFQLPTSVDVWETRVNCAQWSNYVALA